MLSTMSAISLPSLAGLSEPGLRTWQEVQRPKLPSISS
jgi:hypothetical protein